MFIFDAHIDTLQKLVQSNGLYDLASIPNTHVNLAKMQTAGLNAQIFAVFIPENYRHGLALHNASVMIDIFWQNMIKYTSELMPIMWQDELCLLTAETKRIGCILSIEGGEALEGRLENLRNFFRLGVRGLTLTWNNRNELADGVGEGEQASGLSEFGRQVVAEMNNLGMIIDVSHLAEKGFWDVLKISKLPVIASHSNSFARCQHRRNLNDKQITALADQGGVIGVNFCPAFLTNNPKTAAIDHVVSHIVHLIDVGGSEAVGLGSDFDGIASVPQGLEDISRVNEIITMLKNHGYPESVIEKVMGLNFLRVLKQVFPQKSL